MPMVTEPYEPRSIRFLELWEPAGWRIKLYGIAYGTDAPQGELVTAAKAMSRARLPRPSEGDGRYGVGFLGVHEGRGSNLAFLDWWADENELHHHVFISYPEAPTSFTDVTTTGLIACVWDLAVICFERRAWIDTVLLSPERPDLARYLECRFEGAA